MEEPAAGSSTDHGTRAWAVQTRKRRSRAGCFACKQHKKKVFPRSKMTQILFLFD